MNSLLIFIPKRTNRLIYIFNLMFKERMGLKIQLTVNEEEFLAYRDPKLSYGHYPVANEFFVACSELLFERGIQEQEIGTVTYQDLPAIFPTYHRKSVFPFDPFAAAFYLVTRYEEYLPFIKDQYGRFTPVQSIAYQEGFLYSPVVDHWLEDLKSKLKLQFPQLEIAERTYHFTPTIDIDAAYAIKHKGLFRFIGGYMKDLAANRWKDMVYRTQVHLNLRPDPFDTFRYLIDVHRKHHLKVIYFILYADYDTNDKNVPIYSRHFIDLLNEMGDYGRLGIHPSFASNDSKDRLRREVNNLSKSVHREITLSRQHFLVLHFPSTYRNLLDNGILDDYSMGYASNYGFRASTSHSFLFYDLELEYTTALRIHPFMVMEGTLKDYLGYSPEQAYEVYTKMVDEVKSVNGTFISLWHNESVNNLNRWKGWREVYEKMILYALP